ncbi:hypothetical protein BDW_13565 [Bdellovibrio bacteriovorus W]|nr:hypothetical protein BDW_13565 [Bdellovibrio bacteriovorus W]
MPTQISEDTTKLVVKHKSLWSQLSAYLIAAMLLFTGLFPPYSAFSLLFLILALLLVYAGHYVTESFEAHFTNLGDQLHLKRSHGIAGRLSKDEFHIPLSTLKKISLQRGTKRTRRLVFETTEELIALTVSFTNSSFPHSLAETFSTWLMKNGYTVPVEDGDFKGDVK